MFIWDQNGTIVEKYIDIPHRIALPNSVVLSLTILTVCIFLLYINTVYVRRDSMILTFD